VTASCAVSRYLEGPIRDVVLGLKFGGQVHLAKLAAQLMAQRLKETDLILPNTVVLPVPPARRTWASRGLNHTTEVADVLARELKLTLSTSLLRKIRSTAPQATLTDEQRRTNLKGVFAVVSAKAKKYAGRPVLLVDDVITTGSTISECARTLHAAGLGEIRAVSLARG
jgi:ComF family protein